MTTDAFFGQQSPHSAVKARIVSKYFWSWAVLVGKGTRRRDEPLRYLDLFCGRGRYDDGSSSTPLMVLQQVIDNPSFSNLVEAHLSDVKPQFCEALAAELRSMPGLDKLRRAPLVRIREVDDELTREFEATHLPPTLSFVDPWGYKGLSVRLIRALTKDWGCDCVFFFNYNRINTHISNPVLVKQMDHLFGQELAHDLRVRLKGLPPEDSRERNPEHVERRNSRRWQAATV